MTRWTYEEVREIYARAEKAEAEAASLHVLLAQNEMKTKEARDKEVQKLRTVLDEVRDDLTLNVGSIGDIICKIDDALGH